MSAWPIRPRCELRLTLLCALLAGCFEDRARPDPFTPSEPARLSVEILEPRTGLTVPLGGNITVSVLARDLDGRGLTGVGFVARRFAPGFPMVDSAAIAFSPRSDSTHVFTLRIPTTLPNNVQIDVFGIAYGAPRQSRLSTPSYLVGVVCQTGCE